MKKILLVLATLVMTVIVESPLKAQQKEAVVDAVAIGWFGPLSGPVASLGEQNLRGVQLAIKDFGAGRVKLLAEDDRFTA